MIWWLAFEKKSFQFWREIWIQVVIILLQLYYLVYVPKANSFYLCFFRSRKWPRKVGWKTIVRSWLKQWFSFFSLILLKEFFSTFLADYQANLSCHQLKSFWKLTQAKLGMQKAVLVKNSIFSQFVNNPSQMSVK